jgi:hypothetical protein
MLDPKLQPKFVTIRLTDTRDEILRNISDMFSGPEQEIIINEIVPALQQYARTKITTNPIMEERRTPSPFQERSQNHARQNLEDTVKQINGCKLSLQRDGSLSLRPSSPVSFPLPPAIDPEKANAVKRPCSPLLSDFNGYRRLAVQQDDAQLQAAVYQLQQAEAKEEAAASEHKIIKPRAQRRGRGK